MHLLQCRAGLGESGCLGACGLGIVVQRDELVDEGQGLLLHAGGLLNLRHAGVGSVVLLAGAGDRLGGAGHALLQLLAGVPQGFEPGDALADAGQRALGLGQVALDGHGLQQVRDAQDL